MKHLAIAAALLFVACKDRSKDKPAEPPAPATPTQAEQCASALRSFDRFVDTGDASMQPDARAKVKAAVLGRCVEDKWSEPALACMRMAQSSHDTFKCWNEKLTKEQVDGASKALGDLKM
jgi:hypothetical protein